MSLNFNGVSAVDINHNSIADALADNWAVSVWVRTNYIEQSQYIATKRYNVVWTPAHWSFYFEYDPDPPYGTNLCLNVRGPNDTTDHGCYYRVNCHESSPSGVDLLDGKWHHIFGYIESENIYVYTDGIYHGTETPNNPPIGSPANSGKLYIGQCDDGASLFQGDIAHLRTWGTNNYLFYKTQWRRFIMPDSNMRFYFPLNNGVSTYARDLGPQKLVSNSFNASNVLWKPEPLLTMKGG